jgi:response regulator of citrate/malate metabolism
MRQVEEWQIDAMRQAWKSRKLGDTAETLAAELGLSASTFRKYVPGSKVRNQLRAKRHEDAVTRPVL